MAHLKTEDSVTCSNWDRRKVETRI